MTQDVFFDPRQSLEGVASFSPSAAKPALFVAAAQNKAGVQVRMRPVRPVSREDLCRVHDRGYVDGVFDGILANGFDNRDPRVPDACLWQVGSLVSAALAAPAALRPTVSPSSGFHHAGHAWGGGYCTFNGLMVAADQFIQTHADATVGILDCDVHYGDGTDDILQNNRRLATRVVHHTSGRYFRDDADPEEFFLWLQEVVADLNERRCDVVLYQASADMHKDDPLGGFLDDAQMRQRDRIVFRKLRSPIAWNLAGGYRKSRLTGDIEPVLRTHLATLEEAHGSGAPRHPLLGDKRNAG